MRVFLSIDMLRSGTNPVLLLQPLIQWMTSKFLQDLKQRSSEQNSPRKKTPVKLRGGHTNIVAVEAKKAKSAILRNGRTNNWRLLLLSTRIIESHVITPAPGLPDCRSEVQ